MFIEITKDHVAGLKKGEYSKATQSNGEQLIKEGYAKEAKEEDFLKWREKFLKGQEKNKDKVEKPLNIMTVDEVRDYISKKGYNIELQYKASTGNLRNKTKNHLLKDISAIEYPEN